jgi:hypothetical protein
LQCVMWLDIIPLYLEQEQRIPILAKSSSHSN